MTKKGRPPLHMAVHGEHAPGLLRRLEATLKDADALVGQLSEANVRVKVAMLHGVPDDLRNYGTRDSNETVAQLLRLRLIGATRNGTEVEFRRK